MKAVVGAETLTPLIVAGTDVRDSDVVREGLRVPELRGQMRYFFRALLGSAAGSIDELRRIEGRVFGDTKQRSSFSVVSAQTAQCAADVAFLRMNDRGSLSTSGGVVDAPKRNAIPPQTVFTLTLMAAREPQLEMGLLSLWLVGTLGGVGARTRRGFGSIAFGAGDGYTSACIKRLGLSLSYSGCLSDIAQKLSNDLRGARAKLISFARIASPSPCAGYGVISSVGARAWLICPKDGLWNDWASAMDAVRDNVYRLYKRKRGITSIGRLRARKPSPLQAPSPLIIQIKRTVESGFYGLLLAFESDYYFGSGWSKLDKFLLSLRGYEVQPVGLP
jgi:CRISPR type III-B/RAMP module RAMP protein Cmr1